MYIPAIISCPNVVIEISLTFHSRKKNRRGISELGMPQVCVETCSGPDLTILFVLVYYSDSDSHCG